MCQEQVNTLELLGIQMVYDRNSLVVYLALDEGSQQDEDGDAGSDDEVDEVPECQAAHLPQSHLLHLQAEPVPLVPQRPLKANQHHLQSCGRGQDENKEPGRMLNDVITHSYPDTPPGWWTQLIPLCAGPSPCRPGWSSGPGRRPA